MIEANTRDDKDTIKEIYMSIIVICVYKFTNSTVVSGNQKQKSTLSLLLERQCVCPYHILCTQPNISKHMAPDTTSDIFRGPCTPIL
jgi:hypothetical protein